MPKLYITIAARFYDSIVRFLGWSLKLSACCRKIPIFHAHAGNFAVLSQILNVYEGLLQWEITVPPGAALPRSLASLFSLALPRRIHKTFLRAFAHGIATCPISRIAATLGRYSTASPPSRTGSPRTRSETASSRRAARPMRHPSRRPGL